MFPHNATAEWNGMNKTDTPFKLLTPEIIVGLSSETYHRPARSYVWSGPVWSGLCPFSGIWALQR